jgi:hypothetical protein
MRTTGWAVPRKASVPALDCRSAPGLRTRLPGTGWQPTTRAAAAGESYRQWRLLALAGLRHSTGFSPESIACSRSGPSVRRRTFQDRIIAEHRARKCDSGSGRGGDNMALRPFGAGTLWLSTSSVAGVTMPCTDNRDRLARCVPHGPPHCSCLRDSYRNDGSCGSFRP